MTVGGGSSGAPSSGSGGTGYGKAVWAYYIINNRNQSVTINDSIGSSDSWGSSLTISDCGPYGGFWVLQLTTTSDSRFFTAATSVKASKGYREDVVASNGSVVKYFFGHRGGNSNASLISPYRDLIPCNSKNDNSASSTPITNYKSTWVNDYSFAINSFNVIPDAYKNYCKILDNAYVHEVYAVGKNWDQVKALFKSKNNNSTGGCSVISGSTDDCWDDNGSLMKYFCYGDDPEQTFTLSYNKNTTDTVTGMPSSTSCTTTTGSCTVTVSGSPSRANWAFLSWRTNSNGTGSSYVSGNTITLTADKTLYANWKQYNHTLKYDACSGTKPSGKLGDSTVSNGSSSYTFTISSDKPTPPTGYKFIGWSTVSCSGSKNKDPGGTISVGDETKTLYAIYQAYSIATFTAPAITITSTQLNNISGDNWKGLGDKTTYSLTATYHVKRTNATPTSASSNYGTRSATSDDQSYPSNGTSTGGLSNNTTKDIPITYNVAVANGSHATACFYLKYDSEVYYDGSTRIGSKATSTTYKCIDVYNPAKNYAAFSGSVSISNGTGLSGSGANRTGSGYKSTFTVTPTYTITRTDGLTTPSTASSNYAINATTSAFSNSGYPGDSATKSNTGALGTASNNKTKQWNGSASTVDINIGGATQHRCFYLRYDTSVLYYDHDRAPNAGNFAGKTYDCVSITNPPQTTTISFTGAPISGTMTANNRLERSDSNRVGKINNHDRTTSGGDDVIGRWVDNVAARTATYTADFSHKITRNDSSSTILGKTMNAKVSWKVQYAYPSNTPYVNNAGAWVVAGATWSDYATSHENAGNAVSGTTSLGASGQVTINTQPKLQASQGQILYYCQRLAYTASITYATISVADRNDYGVDGGTASAMNTYSSPLCVTLKNPRWSETDVEHLTHTIVVTGTPHDTEFTNNQFIKTGSGANSQHETMVINPTLYVNHTVSRNDTTGDDESDAIFSGKYWQTSIYNNNAYKVTTNLSGYEKVLGLDSSRHLVPVVGGRPTDGSLAVTLGASSKTSSDSWTSTRTSGASRLDFNATGTSKYSVMAGQTRSFTIQSSVRPTQWTVEYKKINLNEYYTCEGGPYPAAANCSVRSAGTGNSTFDRIEKYDAAPKAKTNPAYANSSEVSFSVNRPYNFEITDITPNAVSGVDEQIAYDDDSPSVSYTITLHKQNQEHAYVTDPNHTDNARYVYPVSYVMPADISSSTINSVSTGSKGIHGGVEADICSHFTGLAKAGSCKIYSDSAHPNKLSVAPNSSYDPAAIPTGALVETVFRHVYDDTTNNGYQLSYRTGNITIQNPDGSPLAVGEKFCLAIAVRNYSSASNAYYVSPSSCRNISKRPSFQILGGSTITNGGINTSESTYKNIRFGSWDDFAVIANKSIKRMNSGATALGGVAKSKSVCDRNPLTIANKNCAATSNALGDSNITASTDFIEKLLAYFRNNSTLADVVAENNSRPANHTYIVRNDTQDITIDSNIINDQPSSQIIIIAKNINIKSNVTRIDAWLVAARSYTPSGSSASQIQIGDIDTCSDFADTALSANVCTNGLVVNGQIYANNIKFKRTKGGDPAAPSTVFYGQTSLIDPAETINYTPSTYIWGSHQAKKESNPRTVYVRKLPARY